MGNYYQVNTHHTIVMCRAWQVAGIFVHKCEIGVKASFTKANFFLQKMSASKHRKGQNICKICEDCAAPILSYSESEV